MCRHFQKCGICFRAAGKYGLSALDFNGRFRLVQQNTERRTFVACAVYRIEFIFPFDRKHCLRRKDLRGVRIRLFHIQSRNTDVIRCFESYVYRIGYFPIGNCISAGIQVPSRRSSVKSDRIGIRTVTDYVFCIKRVFSFGSQLRCRIIYLVFFGSRHHDIEFCNTRQRIGCRKPNI